MNKRKTYLLEELTWKEAADLFLETDVGFDAEHLAVGGVAHVRHGRFDAFRADVADDETLWIGGDRSLGASDRRGAGSGGGTGFLPRRRRLRA